MKDVIHIILADDHEIFRDGFAAMFRKQEEIKLVAQAGDGGELLTLTEKFLPQVVVTDIKMPVIDGIEATRLIRSRFPETRVIALSMFDDDNLIMDMLTAGAIGYLLKNAPKEEIIEAIRCVAQGHPYYCSNTSLKLARLIASSRFAPGKNFSPDGLTEREIEIVRMICREKSNKEISQSLFLSIRTIEGYRVQIMEKINVKNTAGIVIYAIRNNLFKP